MGVGQEHGLTIPVNDFIISPGDHNTIFMGTPNGVLRTQDGTSTWTYFGPGTNATVYQLTMSLSTQTTLITTGNGTWCYTFNSTGVPKTQWQNLDSKKSNNPSYSSLSTSTSLASSSR